jgi:hypothetical protein
MLYHGNLEVRGIERVPVGHFQAARPVLIVVGKVELGTSNSGYSFVCEFQLPGHFLVIRVLSIQGCVRIYF